MATPGLPPPSHTGDHVDVLHGVSVPDPYRWLEAQGSAQVDDWVSRQAAFTEEYLQSLPQRGPIADQLSRLWDHPKVGLPWRRGDAWFQNRNSGLQEQSVLWTADGPAARGRPLLDPKELSPDGTVSLTATAVTLDGTMLAYGTSDGGSDWITWRVRDVASGLDTGDVAEWGKFSGAAWTPDGEGFFFGAYDPPEQGQEMMQRNDHHRLRFLRMGGDHGPITVHERPDQPTWGFSPTVTDDGRWLVLHIADGTDPNNRIHLADLGGPAGPEDVTIRPWLDDADAQYHLVHSLGDQLLVQTDQDAPNGRVLAIDAQDPTRRTEVIAEAAPLVGVHVAGGRLVVIRMVDAVHRVSVHQMDGTHVADVPLPDMASVGGMTGRPQDDHVLLTRSSFTRSPSIHRLDVGLDVELREVRPPEVAVADVTTQQVFVDSTDGARVPMFLIRHKDAIPDGTNRTMLYGYGGFDIPITPEFRLWWTVWLQRGGVIAVGCYRGGSEYGRAWHDGGRLSNKPHTFDDALACARWLSGSGWADPENIAITGGSNGGLTAAATMLRAPSAFGACIPEVGVLDLLRFHRFTIGWAWTSDYGDPDDPDDFPLLHSMSPYHTVLANTVLDNTVLDNTVLDNTVLDNTVLGLTEAGGGAAFPATLITTADRDDRVVPAHSFKFAAALQAAQTGPAPVLARIDTRAGHGAGTPTSKLIQARADVMAFMEQVLPGPSGGDD